MKIKGTVLANETHKVGYANEAYCIGYSICKME